MLGVLIDVRMRLAARKAPPSEITEIWDGMFDWLDDYEQGWTFEKLYPITTSSQSLRLR